MRRTFLWAALVCSTLPATVAAARPPGRFFLFNPPPIAVQRADAQRFDPYPLPDVGPGTYADGFRPRGFLEPPPEATRGRWPRPGTFPRVAPVPVPVAPPASPAPRPVEAVPAPAPR
ncbi:MAG: hypothetical protein HYX69_19830 [Planctomycetia bacterium]|nr:hypothetical protein [Planctomycetia bacterium]